MVKIASEPRQEGMTYYDLRAEMNSKQGDMAAPLFMMAFAHMSTFTAAETVALWDRFTSTLRLQGPQGKGK
jgi:hypothetical protein